MRGRRRRKEEQEEQQTRRTTTGARSNAPQCNATSSEQNRRGEGRQGRHGEARRSCKSRRLAHGRGDGAAGWKNRKNRKKKAGRQADREGNNGRPAWSSYSPAGTSHNRRMIGRACDRHCSLPEATREHGNGNGSGGRGTGGGKPSRSRRR